ncbi:MAG: hypothetical protein Q8P50_17330 [Bacillota bacterium]|nr:hypothetical protein [Bacillota bacterium]
MDISSELIAKAQEQSLWSFGNQILYDMCQRAPLHTSEVEIAGKVLLIGRSYAAAIERGAGSPHSGDDFYLHEVVTKMKSVGAELDDRIRLFHEQPRITRPLLGPIVETHGFLTRVFNDISGKNKRSLASKYLHFHVPDIFYIYDSRAASGVSMLSTLDRGLKRSLSENVCDSTYVDFVAKAYPLHVRILEDYGIWLTPRQLDEMLLGCRRPGHTV